MNELLLMREARDAFEPWVEEGRPSAVLAERHGEVLAWGGEELLDALATCPDTVPRETCAELDLERGSTYAQAVAALRDEPAAPLDLPPFRR